MAEKFNIEKGPFKPTWESLRTFECPEWFRDAKLGIWSHWGPQSVGMFGDWYARQIYIEGHDQYRYHWRTYGHPSKFGYKDIVKLWKAEKFDPEGLMKLYVKAGAKYFVAQANHHDNFDNWNSKHHKWNSVKVGPKKNIVGLWQKAAKKHNLPFGVTEHLSAGYAWSSFNKLSDTTGPYKGVPYDGNLKKYEDLYFPNQKESRMEHKPWLTDNVKFHKQWFNRIKDLIDQHKPDLLYTDAGVPFEGSTTEPGLNIIAHLYNVSAKLNHGVNQAIYTQKNRDPKTYSVGALDIERGMEKKILHHPWQTDTCVAGWFYDVRSHYKTPTHVIEMFVDIVSKNGNMLLNFTQRADGSLDDECLYILKCMADWIKINGEGIYNTRPWRVSGEGPITSQGGAFKEDRLEWTDKDFCFTTKPGLVYAFQMKWPENQKAIIKSFATGKKHKVNGVSLLGFKGKISFKQDAKGLHIKVPTKRVCEPAHCFRIIVE